MQDIQDRVKRILVENLGVEEAKISSEAKIVSDLGADSLTLAEIVLALEAEFSIEIPDKEVEEIQTLADAVKFVESRVSANA